VTHEFRVSGGIVERYREALDSEAAGWFPVCPDDLVPALIGLVTQLERDIAALKLHHPFNPNFW
jgi:hypothetical protein